MTNFKQLTMSLAAAAACLASAGVANAVTLVTTYALQTYPAPGHPYTVDFTYDATTKSDLVYSTYFGPVNSDDLVSTYTIPVDGIGSYMPPATFSKSTSLTYQLVAVPEPVTWAMMLVGFGAIGLGLRGTSRRSVRTA